MAETRCHRSRLDRVQPGLLENPEHVEQSRGKIRGDVVHEKLQAWGSPDVSGLQDHAGGIEGEIQCMGRARPPPLDFPSQACGFSMTRETGPSLTG